MNIRRFRQVWHYANRDSLELKRQNGKGNFYRLNIFIDMINSTLTDWDFALDTRY